MLKEFKEFALKGNMIDLAVGVIIGGGFNTLVSSLVNDIVMPFISLFTGKVKEIKAGTWVIGVLFTVMFFVTH